MKYDGVDSLTGDAILMSTGNGTPNEGLYFFGFYDNLGASDYLFLDFYGNLVLSQSLISMVMILGTTLPLHLIFYPVKDFFTWMVYLLVTYPQIAFKQPILLTLGIY